MVHEMAPVEQMSDTQELILDAALACIARDGLDSTSLRDVAREADVSLGLLGYHFDDRQTLLVAAFELTTDRLLDQSLASLDGLSDPAERAEAFVLGAFDEAFLEADYLALRLALWAIARTDGLIGETEETFYRRYRLKMIELLAAALPEATKQEVEDRATDIIVMQNGLWLDWARHGNRTDLERGLRRCVERTR